MRPGFAVIGAAIPVSDFAGMVTAILSDVNPEEISALSWGGTRCMVVHFVEEIIS